MSTFSETFFWRLERWLSAAMHFARSSSRACTGRWCCPGCRNTFGNPLRHHLDESSQMFLRGLLEQADQGPLYKGSKTDFGIGGKETMIEQAKLGGAFTLPGTSMRLNRMGYGAMQLAGPQVFGPPRDVDAAIAVLREAIATGVNHIDTSDYYGPHVTNQIIKQALHPYPNDLVIVTKVGARRGDDKSWIHALSRQELIDALHDNLRNLGVDQIDVVNLRVGGQSEPADGSIAEPLTVLAELKRQGLIAHIGLSNVTPNQLAEAQRITEIVCIQNFYNVAHRNDDAFIDALAQQGIAYVPFFPLGGFTPLQSEALDRVAASLQATPMQVALAWLLQRSPNILLIPGTSSVDHLRENLQAAALELPANAIAELNAINKGLAESQSTS
jgi:aryl-alcohol dehydrogenase-like predicted oxidoreductase